MASITRGNRFSLTIALLACGVFYANASYAMLIFDNGSDLTNSGMFSEAGQFNDGGMTWLIQAGDTFRLSTDSTVEQLRWWGWNAGSNQNAENAFEVAIYAFSGGTPSNIAFYTHQPLSVDRTPLNDGTGTFEYVASIDPIFLSADTDYLLSIVNDFATPSDLSDFWVWRRSLDGLDGTHSSRQSMTTVPGNWITDGFTHDLAFQILGAPIPIPGAALLFGTGVLGLIGLARRKRNQALKPAIC